MRLGTSGSRHATAVLERRRALAQVTAAQVELQLAFFSRSLVALPQQNGFAFRPPPRTSVSGGWRTVRRKVYIGYTRPPGYMKRCIPTRLGAAFDLWVTAQVSLVECHSRITG
jgi:hypothetical protein